LFLELDLTVPHCTFHTPKYEPKPSWRKATSAHIDDYKRLLCHNLHDIVLPSDALLCRKMINIGRNISDACLSAGAASLPYTGRGSDRGRMPGWTEHETKPLCGTKLGLNLEDPGME